MTPIREKFLENNYLFALLFREGLVFGRTVKRRICVYKPWALIDSAGNAVDIAASSHAGEYRFRDPRNTNVDILYLDTATSAGYPWILHGAFGIRPPKVRMYLRIPEGKEIPGKFPSLDPIKPASGDSVGYIDSELSPYEEPTDYSEIIIPPKVHIAAEYYNTDDTRAHQPVLNIMFAVYWFQPLSVEKHRRLIGAIARREVPAAFLTVGVGDYPLELGGLRTEWEVEPLSIDEAAELR